MKYIKYTKRLYLLISLIIIGLNLASQTVTLYTPNGSAVEAFYQDEMPSSYITYYTDQYRNTYPQAEVLANASATYNCHSYAWNLAEGGNTVCWLDQNPDLHKYWDDYSYFETTEGSAEKIFYYSGDHSAIKSSIQGKYDSKWGAMPLMRHAPDYGPAIYQMTNRKYYQKASNLRILGASSLCYSGSSFSISNLPSNATISWSTSSNVTRVSSQGANPCTFRALSSNTLGNGTITATITINGNISVVDKNIWIGEPQLYTYDANGNEMTSGQAINVNAGTVVTFEAYSYDLSASIDWEITPSTAYYSISGNTCTVMASTGFIGVMAKATNNCGEYILLNTLSGTSGGFPLDVNVYPNPTSTTINIEMLSKAKSAQDETYEEIQLYDTMMNMRKQCRIKSHHSTINVSNLRSGIYYLRIKSNKNVYVKQIVIER